MTTKKSYSKSDPSGEKSGKPTNFTPPDGNSGDKKPSPQQKKSKLLWTLFLTFCKIGGFTFGGGYAMIPLIEREAVEKRRFLDGDEIVELLAISEATPGPIAVNAATFVGYRAAGVPGAFFATLGVVLPSFCILLLISAFYDRFAALRPVEYAFRGIRAAVPALLLRALWTTFRKCPKDLPSLLLLAAAFLLTVWGILPAFLLPIGFALSGILLLFLKRRRTK